MNPEIIGIVGARQPKRKPPIRADLIFQPLLIHGVDVERRIGEHEIKFAGGSVRVIVVADGLLDVAFQAMHGKVHPAQVACGTLFFLTVNRQFLGRTFLVLGHEPRGLHKHTA